MSNERSPRGLCSTTIGTSGMAVSFRQLPGCQPTIATIWLSKEPPWTRAVRSRSRRPPRRSGRRSRPRRAARRGSRTPPTREILVETAEEPHRLVWWWWTEDAPATRVEVLVVAAPAGARVVVVESEPSFPLARSRPASRSRTPEMSDTIGPVFAALADPTRRHVVETLVRDGSTSVPALSSALPISRQAIAKHLAALGDAGSDRAGARGTGREVRYRLRAGALRPRERMARRDGGGVGRAADAAQAQRRG